jgi:virulence factor Mce-like protein
MRRTRKRGPSNVTAAIVTIVVLSAATFLAFTKDVPFVGDKYKIDAIVPTANSMRAGSFVRIAGVNVGKVTKVEPVAPGEDGRGLARITMELDEAARPIHKDAKLKIRPRIFFEGNFFVDLQPGSPSMPEMRNGDTMPVQNASTPVQFDQVLTSLQSDTRRDLKTLVNELGTALRGGGAQAVNRTIPYWEPAYRNSAIVNDATLGQVEHDLSGYIRGAGRTAEALDRNAEQLKDLITDFRVTAGALAERDGELSRGIAALPRTLRAGQPALAELDRALPPVRRLVADLRPGVRSSGPAIEAQMPFVRQLRGLVSRAEGRGLAADLRGAIPALARLNGELPGFMEEGRLQASCQNEVVVPWANDKIEDPDFPATGKVYESQARALVGLAGESRSFDANGQWFRVSVATAQAALAQGDGLFLLSERPVLGANPPRPEKRPELRPDVPCETQEQPDLRTQQTDLRQKSMTIRKAPDAELRRSLKVAIEWMRERIKAEGREDELKVSDDLLGLPDIRALGRRLGR